MPPGFFALPAWEAISLETVLERSCHQRYNRIDLQSSSGRDTAVAWGGLQQFPRQLAEAERCRLAGVAAKQWSLQCTLEQRDQGWWFPE